MKKIYVLLILFCVALQSMAQIAVDPKGTRILVDSSKWKISGNNIYNKNSGSIGIGTATPTAQLHTTGTVRLQGIGTNTTNTSIVTTDPSGNVTTRSLSNLLSGNAITSLNGLTNSTQIFATGTTGTDFNIVSSASAHTFNIPSASASGRGALTASDWTTFNNKIGTVTATIPAAVSTTSNTATVNNTAAYWNANQLQGKDIATTSPANGQVLTYNTATAKWEPAATSVATTTVSNTNTAPNSLTTTVNGVTGTAVPIVNTVSNTSANNTIKTTVNGIAGATVNIINTNTLTQNGTYQIMSTVNGVASSALTANITGDITGNLGASVVSKINGSPLGTTTGASNGQVLTWNGSAWTPATVNATTTVSNTNNAPNSLYTTVNGVSGQAVPIINSVSNNSNNNTLTTTVNGITGTSVPIVNSISNNLSGTNLTTTVNGVTGAAVNLAAIIPATTHTMSLSGNTLTSNVNGIAATSNSVATVANSSSANTLTTAVNGVAGSGVNIINSNVLTYTGNILTSTVNGVSSSIPVTVVTSASNGLTITGTNVELGGTLDVPTTINTSAANTLSLTGLQAGTSTDNILVATAGGVIKQVPQVSFPQLLVDCDRTTAYTPTAAYSTIVYNTAPINVGNAYNTTTGVFTAPATGMYQIMVNNGYTFSGSNAQGQIANRIIVNGITDMETYQSGYRSSTNINSTVSSRTIVSITAGQTVSISCGGEIGTATPLTGTAQHVLKIIRLQ